MDHNGAALNARHPLTKPLTEPLAGSVAEPQPKTGGAPLNPTATQVAQFYRRDKLSPFMVSGVMRLAEFVLLSVLGFSIYLAYVGGHPDSSWVYLGVSLGASIIAVVLLDLADTYRFQALLRPLIVLRPLFIVWSITFALMVTAAFLTRTSTEFSRVWTVAWYFLGLLALIGFRFIVSRIARRLLRSGQLERRAVIVGGGGRAEELIRELEKQPFSDIRICGIFDDRDDRRSPPLVAGHPKLGTIAELIEFGRIARIDILIVTLPLTAEKRVQTLLKELWVLPVDIRLSAHSSDLSFRPRAYSFVGDVPMFDLYDRPINNWDSVAKRGFDLFFGTLALLALWPVMVATAIAIKLDSKGPVIFRQKRHGFNNETIEVYKFRSMYVEQNDASGLNAVRRGDPRVTRVGRFIRKTSIDELPQFFNVLRGNLSLVGPRPHVVSAATRDMVYNDVVDSYFARHRVKPGVTGWAQINGLRGEIDSEDKIRKRTEFDLYYIENWSIWLDLKILLMTPVSLLNTENAY